MDVFIVDGDDVILKNIATIRRNPEVDSFEVCCLEIRLLSRGYQFPHFLLDSNST